VQRKVRAKPKIAPPKINVTRSPAPIGIRAAAQSTTGGAGVAFLLIVTSLAMAIACFGVASVPATVMPPRAAADFVVRHKVDMTMLGFGLLAAAAVAMLWNSQL